MARLGGRGACKGASLDKKPVALAKGAEAGARAGGFLGSLEKQKLLFFIAQHYPLALWGCLRVLELAQNTQSQMGLDFSSSAKAFRFLL